MQLLPVGMRGRASLALAMGLAVAAVVGPVALPARTVETAEALAEEAPADLMDQGLEQYRQGQLQAAIASYQRALAHYQQRGLGAEAVTALNRIARVQITLGSFAEALALLGQAMAQSPAGNEAGQGETLNLIGLVHRRQGNDERARQQHRAALQLAATSPAVAAEAHHGLGAIAARQGNYGQALARYRRALRHWRQTQDRWGAARTLHNLGNLYYNQSDYPQAMAYYQRALQQRRGDRLGEQRTLQAIGRVLQTQGQIEAALGVYQKALAVLQQAGDRASAGVLLSNIGALQEARGEYAQALDYHQQALTLAQALGDRQGIAAALDNLGGVQYARGRYAEALTQYQRALGLHWQLGDRLNEGRTLVNLGGVYERLGRYPQALYVLQQATAIHQAIGHRAGVAQALQGMGDLRQQQGETAAAAATYRAAQEIAQTLGDPSLGASLLNRLGGIYAEQGHPDRAIAAYGQALAQRQTLGDRPGQGATLNNLAVVYLHQGDLEEAETALHQALGILRAVGERYGERVALANLGSLLERQGHPQLAIAFYKAAVNLTEAVRGELAPLAPLEQQAYLGTVAGLYRRLADLLLQENRVLEAQRVVDLLKVQELDDYLRTVRGNGQTAAGVEAVPLEQQLMADYQALQNQAIAVGQALVALRQSPATPEQRQRLAELTDQQRQVTRQFVEFTRRPDVAERVRQLSQTTRDRSLPLASLRQLSNNLAQLGPGTALLYPLVLEDRVELILVTADSPPVRRTVAVGRVAINQAIAQFRSALEDPSSEAQAPAQQLYDWLVRPLENDLSQAQVQNLLYAPDDQLRYIPLAALHDGEGWLVERLRTSSITAASLTDFTASPQPELRLLAGAFTQGEYQVKAGDRRLSFGGLPFAGQEVRALSALVPEATAVFDQAFNRAAVEPQLNSYTAVHLATHAAFLPGQPDESFILLGDGDRITLRDVELEWFLTNVDLVVLSACETGVGGFGSGEEILGFGYLMQDAGARAAIASLWAVSDGGTQALMTHFYRALLTEGMTKAEALRQAQVALITGQHQAEADGDRGVSLRPRSPDAGPVASDLSHPYYWAPFILIGNGL